MAFDNDEYVTPPLPRRGDKLFAHNRANWQMDAMMNFRQGDPYAYRTGYRMAGRILTESAAERGWVDLLVYPICHAYRHYVELTLKHLIAKGCRVTERLMTDDEKRLCTTSHNLSLLFACFKKIERETATATGESYPSEDMDGINAYIEQLHEVDQGSFSFRYAHGKNSEVSLGELERINLAQFSDFMERLCIALECIDSEYGQILSAMEDMYRDSAP